MNYDKNQSMSWRLRERKNSRQTLKNSLLFGLFKMLIGNSHLVNFSSWFSPRQSGKAVKSNLSLSGSARQKSDEVAIKHHQRSKIGAENGLHGNSIQITFLSQSAS